MPKQTPMMRQYHRIKRDHRDAILLFHLGDFYEMFYEDAEESSRILNIALTSRDRNKEGGVPLCGIPCHAAESYINRLLQAGKKVAICDQVEDASNSRGLVRREVTRVITPGTVLDDKMLDSKSNNYLVTVSPQDRVAGIAAADLSTGEFYVLEVPSGDLQRLEDRLTFFSPAEIVLSAECGEDIKVAVSRAVPPTTAITIGNSGDFDFHSARENLLQHFQTATLETYGCQDFTAGVTAAGALLAYIRETQRRPLSNLVKLTPFFSGTHMILDSSTQRNLELVGNLEDGRREGSLLGVLDRTVTSMGGRRLRRWLLSPLMSTQAIEKRLDAVEELVSRTETRIGLRSILRKISDLERLGSRISLNSGTPRDLAALSNSLKALPELVEELRGCRSQMLSTLVSIDILSDVRERIEERLVEDPPLKIKEGGLIRRGFSPELDELRDVSNDAKTWLSEFEKNERQRTSIPSLKVGYNRVFGYYIEVTKSNLEHIPSDYARKQTLVNAERFQSENLVEFENRILGAEEKIVALEQVLFEQLRASLAADVERLQITAAAVATLDVIQSQSEVAVDRNFCRPYVNEGCSVEIAEGRHPVIEAGSEERFVPNDCSLDSENCQIMIITGPNMAGKSTYLRQVALITLMAQAGSYVPAREARIGVVDRIFTRIGAADKLSRGQSTFMVEMVETAAILHNSTDGSLIILDEVGRGTSTFDGLSIAWAVAEYIHGTGRRGPKTLFATHYHHLTELPLTLKRAKNFNISVREWEEKIHFLRKIVEGGADRSYGIQVAQLAGLPASTVERAREILGNLEQGEFNLEGYPQLAQRGLPAAGPPSQMDIFTSPAEDLVALLLSLDIEKTTPLEALSLLARMKEDIEKNRF